MKNYEEGHSEKLFIYDNYDKAADEKMLYGMAEYVLLSDSIFSDEYTDENCPYIFYNLVNQEPGEKIVLRVKYYSKFPTHAFKEGKKDLTQTDSQAKGFNKKSNEEYYCGLSFPHDLIAICSLILGVRLKVGARTRNFASYLDPLGSPANFESDSKHWSCMELAKINNKNLKILPNIEQYSQLNELEKLSCIKKLSIDRVFVLIKASNLYHEAIWIAEFEPQRAWLLLVSAIETVANLWHCKDSEDKKFPFIIDLIKNEIPQLNELFSLFEEQKKEEQFHDLIEYLIERSKATKKFIIFVLEFFRDDLLVPCFSSSTSEDKAKILKKIYEYRSRALHKGIPFPPGMCSHPKFSHKYKHNNKDKAVYHESCSALGEITESGSWVKKDLPLNLNAFTIITRNILLNWYSTTHD